VALVPVFVFVKDKGEMAIMNNITLNPDFNVHSAALPYRFYSSILLLNDRIYVFVEASPIYFVAEK
jgi:hypothetical protein